MSVELTLLIPNPTFARSIAEERHPASVYARGRFYIPNCSGTPKSLLGYLEDEWTKHKLYPTLNDCLLSAHPDTDMSMDMEVEEDLYGNTLQWVSAVEVGKLIDDWTEGNQSAVPEKGLVLYYAISGYLRALDLQLNDLPYPVIPFFH